MCKVVIAKTTEISHEEWLALRQKGIGGSEAAAVCGFNRYCSPLEVWLRKTGRKEAEADNEAMYFGRLLEPIIREEFSRRTNLKVQTCSFMFSYREFPFMLANIDGVVTEKDGTKALLEIKTTNSFTTAKDFEDGLPVEWYFQVQHYMAVTDLNKGYVAVLIGGNQFKYQVVERDEETIENIIALESHFWNEYVLKDVPPPADYNSGECLATLYPESDGSSVILPVESEQLVDDYLKIKAAEEDLKKSKAETENKLKALLKESESGITPSGYKVSWKSYSQSRFDTTKFKAAHAELAAQFTTTTNGRKFSVSEPKAKK